MDIRWLAVQKGDAPQPPIPTFVQGISAKIAECGPKSSRALSLGTVSAAGSSGRMPHQLDTDRRGFSG